MRCNCPFVLLKSIRILPKRGVSGYYKECVSRALCSEIKNVIIITWRANDYTHFLLESQRKKYKEHINLRKKKMYH